MVYRKVVNKSMFQIKARFDRELNRNADSIRDFAVCYIESAKLSFNFPFTTNGIKQVYGGIKLVLLDNGRVSFSLQKCHKVCR